MDAPQSAHGAGHGDSPVAVSDAKAVNSAANRQFYKARVPIYPKQVHGQWRRVKWLVMAVTLGIYYGVPWLRWYRGPGLPDQAVLVDLAHERFYFFAIELWPQEVYYITGLLILAALGIFTAAATLGRVWCGYTCPQTVWTDLFVHVERLVEGDRSAQMRLAAAPMSLGKAFKRAVKHSIWLIIAAATGGAWVFYFADAPSLARQLFSGTADVSVYAFIAILTFTTYAFGGLMREQVCTYMCPWPRIQAALIDRETLSVIYRLDRGEPRGPHKKGQSWEGRGACIDCNQCVAACPMGIDIRDGAQLECINCALCIDACDDVMSKVGLPAGLIAYDTAANIERRQRGETARFRFIRPRTALYAALFAAVGLLMAFTLATRPTLALDVLRDRNPTYVRLAGGGVRNGFTLKLMNHAPLRRMLILSIDELPGARINVIGEGEGQNVAVMAEGDRVQALRALVTLDARHANARSLELGFVLRDPKTGERAHVETVFLTGN